MNWALLTVCTVVVAVEEASGETLPSGAVVRDRYGAIIRGDVAAKRLSLVFTGGERGESTRAILDALKQRNIKAALFVTGAFLRDAALRPLLDRALAEGHYVGPHSDSHPLYCSWDNREHSLVTEAEFVADLTKNIADVRSLGTRRPSPLRGEAGLLFIPPYEWYNADQVRWARAMGVTLINFTPGSGSNRDYAPEGDERFVPSHTIYGDILAYEEKDPHGLNGFILLLHLGSGREDPFHTRLGPLCDELSRRGYDFVRIDELIGDAEQPK